MQTARPSPRQLEYQDWEFGIFLHFGIRTFHEGHRDWDGREMLPSAFRPSALDCDQWALAAKQAGARYMVLTAKHHDGFANWPSRYTDFSVAASPWRDGRGDVVRDFTEACRRHGLKPGLYYSPAEWGNPTYENPECYDQYFIDQVSELLTGYGQIDILWFDGCGSAGHNYDWLRITAAIRRLQPDILLFELGDPDFRWVGNEEGLAPLPCWNTVMRSSKGPAGVRAGAAPAEAVWLPAECDCRMRQRNWFYSDADADTVKSVDELIGLYYYSVGRGCNLLLNIGPDRRGLLPEPDAARLLEFGAERRRRFAQPVAELASAARSEGCWDFDFPEPVLLDHALIQEDLTAGEHVRRFSLAVNPNHKGVWIQVWRGENIGHKAICHFPTIAVRRLRLSIEASTGPAALRRLDLYCAGQRPAATP